MSAGLTAATRDLRGFRHVTAMADYALRLREQLQYVNEHSFNSFRIRIGKSLFHCAMRPAVQQSWLTQERTICRESCANALRLRLLRCNDAEE